MSGGLAAPRGILSALVERVRALGFAAWALGFILLWVVLAFLSPIIAASTNDIDLRHAYAGMSLAHPLGTDASGRDVLMRLIVGARTALVAPLIVVAISGTIGVALALVGALRGGWVDAALNRLFDLIFAFPSILLALIGIAIFGPGLASAIGALVIAYIPYTARIVRSEALRHVSMDYVRACRLNGISDLAIAVGHLLPNLAPLVVAQLTLSFGYAIIDLASISFLGLGVQAPNADWGLIAQMGQSGILQGHPHESIGAGGLIVLLVVSFSLVGDALDGRAREVVH